MVSEWRSVIAVSLNVSGGVRLIKPAKYYKHNEDGCTAPGVCGIGSVPQSHSGNIVTRIGIHPYIHAYIRLIKFCSFKGGTVCDHK